MHRAVDSTKEKLLNDFNTVVTEAEQLVKSVASESGDKAHALLAKVEQNLKIARERVGELQGVVVQKTKAAARVTDDYVHENPWKSIGIAAGIGVVIGLLLNRR
ncbi:MAG: YqjD family protein [Pseudomonadota bacterium]